MKQNTKKIFLSAAALGTAVAALSAVSCGVKRYDTKYDKTVNLDVPWEGHQLAAVQELARVYNEKEKGTPDFLEVKVTSVGNGKYNIANDLLVNELKAGSTTTIPNIVINYPPTLSTISGYLMGIQLDGKTIDGVENKYVVNKDAFEPAFLTFNDRIGGIKPGGIYGLPITKSTDVMGINTPIMSYIFESMVSLGAKVDESDPDFKKWYEGVLQKGKGDRESVKKSWGDVRQSEKSKYADYTISASTFKYTKQLIDFSQRAQDLFTNTYNNLNATNHVLTLGGSPFNLIATNLFSLTAAKKDDYSNYLSKIGSSGTVDYSNVVNKDSPTYKALEKISPEIISAVKKGGIFFANTYPSELIRNNKIAIAYSSSAGYRYSYSDAKSQSDFLAIKIDKDKKPSYKGISNIADISIPENGPQIATYKQWGNTNVNNVFKSTDSASAKTYDIQLEDAAADTAFEAFLKKIQLDENKSKKYAIIYNTDALDDFYNANKDLAAKTGLELLGKAKIGKGAAKNIYGILDLANKALTEKHDNVEVFDYVPYNQGNTLQQNELEVLPAPTKWDSTSKINAIYLQGPSLMAVHNNTKEDIASLKFIKWLTSTKKYAFRYKGNKYLDNQNKETDNISNAKMQTPLQFLSQRASYVVPYKGAFDDTSGLNLFTKAVYKEFKNVISKPDWSFVEDPADELSNSFRSAFGNAYSTIISNIVSTSGNSAFTGDYTKDILPNINRVFQQPEK